MSRVPSPTFIPRSQRPKAWGDRASTAARAAGARALAQAEAAIAATWGPARRANDLKLDVERAMSRGAHDHDVRARYMKVALLLPTSVDAAIRTVERNYRAERRHQDQLEALMAPFGNRLYERHLAHMRLFLRWLRRYGDVDAFPEIVETLTTSVCFRMEAAE